MTAHQAWYPIAVQCRVLRVSVSGYYAWRNRLPSQRTAENAALSERIAAIHQDSRQTYGAPRVHAELSAGGVRVSRKRVARLMRCGGLIGVTRRRSVVTTRRASDARPAADLVRRNFKAKAPNELWVADISVLQQHGRDFAMN